MGRRSSVRGNFMHVKTSVGLQRFEVEKSRAFFQDFLEFLEITELLEVAPNLLKIGQRVAYGLAVIATRGLNSRQNSYRFRAI